MPYHCGECGKFSWGAESVLTQHISTQAPEVGDVGREGNCWSLLPVASCNHSVQAQVLLCPATGATGLHWLHSLMAWPLERWSYVLGSRWATELTPMLTPMLQGASCVREEGLAGDPFPEQIPALIMQSSRNYRAYFPIYS